MNCFPGRVELQTRRWAPSLAHFSEHLVPVLVREVRQRAQLRDLFEEELLLDRCHLHLLWARCKGSVTQIGDVLCADQRLVQVVASRANDCRHLDRLYVASSARIFIESDSWVLILMLEKITRNLVRAWTRTGVELLWISMLEGVANVD